MLVGPFPYSTWHTYLGTVAQERRMDITANNLANVNTAGFKRDVPIFEGYIIKATQTDFSQGQFQLTKNKLDVALSGPGFFQLETPQGLRYTRDGRFTKAADGRIVSNDGHPVLGAGIIPPNAVDVVIDTDGRVMADGQEVGRIEVVEFNDVKVLAKDGYNRFVPKVAGITGQPAKDTIMEQGYIELSNADPVLESVNMIDTVRSYEAFQKIAHSIQEADQKTINDVGRLV